MSITVSPIPAGMFIVSFWVANDSLDCRDGGMLDAGMDPAEDYYIMHEGYSSAGYGYTICAFPLLKPVETKEIPCDDVPNPISTTRKIGGPLKRLPVSTR